MAKIHNLKIKNFRGIKELDHTFGPANFICLVGRGDSCKTTILEAIEYALYPSWNLTLNDNDFFNCDTSIPLEIEVTLRGVDDNLLRDTKFGLYIRGLDVDGETVCDEIQDGQEKLLTILFKVEKDLEPKWFVTSHRPHQEDVKIDTSDRASFNVFLLSDYLDKHFSWSKGTPLYALLKQDGSSADNTVLLDAIRELKTTIDSGTGFSHLNTVIDKVKSSTLRFGVNIDKTKTSIDIKDLAIKDSKVILHDDLVPLRLKGKGSKRLISVAIQDELTKNSILLVDEIEQGLEPDRVKHLVRTLCCNTNEQTFITTHSQQVVEELDPENIFVVNEIAGKVTIEQTDQDKCDKYKRLFRTVPEALYAKSVIVCEGKTELGFCRAIDKQRVLSGEMSMAMKGVVYANGGGDGFQEKARILKELGKRVCVFCDSDKDGDIQNPTKSEMKTLNIDIFDCEVGNNIEKQISKDLSWDGIKELCSYVIKDKNISTDFTVFVKASTNLDFADTDTPENREIFFKASTYKKEKNNTDGTKKIEDKSWFKRIDHGEVLGDICIKYRDRLAEGSKLKELMSGIDNWVNV